MGTRNSTTARLLIVSLALAKPVAAQKHQPLRAQQRSERREERQAARKQQPRQVFGQLQQLPPDRRRMVGTAIRDLRAMPPEQRQEVIESERFKSMFSPQERDLLTNASRLPLAPAENQNEQGPEE